MKKIILISVFLVFSTSAISETEKHVLCQHSKNPSAWKKKSIIQEDLYVFDFEKEHASKWYNEDGTNEEGPYTGIWLYDRQSGRTLHIVYGWGEITLDSIKVPITFPWGNQWIGQNGMSDATIDRKTLDLWVDRYPVQRLMSGMQYKNAIVGSCKIIDEEQFTRKVNEHKKTITKDNQL
jgi:hypothetical protein